MNTAENLLINQWMMLNLFGSLVQHFFEMVTKLVRKPPRNKTSSIFWLKSFFFCPPTIQLTNHTSLVTQQNVPRTDEIHRHFFIIDGGLASKKKFISSVGGVGLSKCKGKLNTFENINNNVNLPLLLLAVEWAKAEKMQDHVFGGFFVLSAGVLPLQKFTHLIIILKVFVSSFHSVVHPEGCVLLQWQDEGLDKKCDKIRGLHFLSFWTQKGRLLFFWRVFLILCSWICPLLLHTKFIVNKYMQIVKG